MADDTQYNYEAMDNGFESLLRASKAIESECDNLTKQSKSLLDTIGGGYADAYQVKVTELNREFDELNTNLQNRARSVQDGFNAMGQTDIKLGDGF